MDTNKVIETSVFFRTIVRKFGIKEYKSLIVNIDFPFEKFDTFVK